MILTSDFWESIINDQRIDRFPDWEMVDKSINRLDKKMYTLVVLDDEKGSNLSIGGGPSGVVAALSSGQDHLIAREGDGTMTISVVLGGQAGDYRKRNVISVEHAKGIAKAYLQGSDVRALYDWDTD
jgi:Ethanolamine utilization protein EutJ (predicted chaperonin)